MKTEEEVAKDICDDIEARAVTWTGDDAWRDCLHRIDFYILMQDEFERKPFRQKIIQETVMTFIKKRRCELIEKFFGTEQEFKERLQKAFDEVTGEA